MPRLSPGVCPLLAILASPALATIVEDLSIEEMVAPADCVVLGRVARVWSELDPDGSQVFTRVRIQVERCCKDDGAGPHRTVELRFEGGTAGGVTMRIQGMPRFSAGDRVLVFLFRNEGEEFYRPLGLSHGCFACCHDERRGRTLARRDLTGVQLLRRRSDGDFEPVEGGRDPDRPLDLLLNQIESVASRTR